MTDQEYLAEQQAKVRDLRREADADDDLARQVGEDNPTWAEHLAHRARHKRWLANEADGGR